MDGANFDWDDANISHIARHDVTPEETEEVLLGSPLDVGFDIENGEERWSYVGETNEGRILRVLLTLQKERIRVITAFDSSTRLKVRYLEWKADQT